MEMVARTPAQLGAALKSARIRLGLNQTDAAARVGLKQKTVSSLETVGTRTTIATLYKILSALNLELVVREKNSVESPREW